MRETQKPVRDFSKAKLETFLSSVAAPASVISLLTKLQKGKWN